jgi:hypothetical protein
MMPAWAWWGLIGGGLFGFGWLCGRLRRPQGPAGTGPWDMSWALYSSPNGGATPAILEGIRGAKRTSLVHAYLLYSTRLAGALVRAHQRGVQVHVIHKPPPTIQLRRRGICMPHRAPHGSISYGGI